MNASALAILDELFPDHAAATREWLRGDRRHLLVPGSANYPPLLSDIPGPPKLLYVAGDPDVLHLPTLAIVGSRNPTAGGRRIAFDFSTHLAGNGFCIASGLADGIDTEAHRGALAAGGKTVAFLGHGIDQIYPAANRSLAESILQTGALVAEFPLGTPPARQNFPQRNRLISGVSLGTLVVEAAQRSGSLITARLAGEQGREVFAIPGSIHNPMAKGCHQLIRNGAKLVESADDIVSELGEMLNSLGREIRRVNPEEPEPSALPDEHRALLDIIGHDPVGLDALSKLSGLTIAELSSMLLILELEGKVERLSGGRFCALQRTGPPQGLPNTAE